MITKKKITGYIIATGLILGGLYSSLQMHHDGSILTVTPIQAWGLRSEAPIMISVNDTNRLEVATTISSAGRGVSTTKYNLVFHSPNGKLITLYSTRKSAKCETLYNRVCNAYGTDDTFYWRRFPYIMFSGIGAFILILVLGKARVMTAKEKREWMPN